jgi:hypothetical protein
MSLKKLTTLAAMIAGLASTPIMADNFATINGDENVVYWDIDPSVEYQSITLTLSSSNSSPQKYEFADAPMTPELADGGYKYELVVTPVVDSTMSRNDGLDNGRDSAMQPVAQGQIQSGFFTIANGSLVPALTEQ